MPDKLTPDESIALYRDRVIKRRLKLETALAAHYHDHESVEKALDAAHIATDLALALTHLAIALARK